MVEHARDCPASLGPMDCSCGAERTHVIPAKRYPDYPPGPARDNLFARVFATEDGAQVLVMLRHGDATPDEIASAVDRVRAYWMTGQRA